MASHREIRKEVRLPGKDLALQVLGQGDEHLRILESLTGVQAQARGTTVLVSGSREDVSFAERVLRQMSLLARQGFSFRPRDVERAVRALNRDPHLALKDVFLETVLLSERGRPIRPLTVMQKSYVDAIRCNDIVFAIGPAGTGKTYLAMAMAVAAFLRKEYERIILTRPAVEAGEKLGFLPGDLAEKVNPYLRPLYDALQDMMPFSRVRDLMEQGRIEVAPLAFMRGRTLNHAFVVLDEAQNTTREQMKMFLTRLGPESRAVITGDITQVDLPSGTVCGLTDALEILDSIKGIGFCRFSEADVVRHPLVQVIVKAYDRAEHRSGRGVKEPGAKEQAGTNGESDHLNEGAMTERPLAARGASS